MASGGAAVVTTCVVRAFQLPFHTHTRIGALSAPLISANGRPHTLLALHSATHIQLCADAYGRVERAAQLYARGVDYTHILMWHIIAKLRMRRTSQRIAILHSRDCHASRKEQVERSVKDVIVTHKSLFYKSPFTKLMLCPVCHMTEASGDTVQLREYVKRMKCRYRCNMRSGVICANFVRVLDDSETSLSSNPKAGDCETWNIRILGPDRILRQ